MSLKPLIWQKTPPRAQRPEGFPTLIYPQPPNAVPYYEDFFNQTVATARFVDSGTDTAAYGNPNWVVTEIGTAGAGSVGCQTSRDQPGHLSITTGTTLGDGLIVDSSYRLTNSAGSMVINPAIKFHFMFRFSINAPVTDCKHGIALIRQSYATGTDWVTDPDVALGTGGPDSFVIYRDSAAYGAGAMTTAAGDLTLRHYTSTGPTSSMLVLKASASITTTTAVKVEGYCAGDSVLHVAVDGVEVGTMDISSLGAANIVHRTSFGVYAQNGVTKSLNIDALMQEWQPSLIR